MIALRYFNRETTYDQAVSLLRAEGYDPFNGEANIAELMGRWSRKEITLPNDNAYIVGLEEKDRLERTVYPGDPGYADTILYRVPIICSFVGGMREISHTCFSESDEVNNFQHCYIAAVKM